MSAGGWLRVDERTDVLASLSECLHCLRRLSEEPPTWKWVILSIHNALQGAMVCHLSGTAQLGALEEKSVTAAMEWHDKDGRGEIGKVLVEEDEWGMPTYKARQKRMSIRPSGSLAQRPSSSDSATISSELSQ